MKEEELKKVEEIASRIKEKAKETIELETKKAKEELLRFGMKQAKELALQRLFQDFENPDIQKNTQRKCSGNWRYKNEQGAFKKAG